MSRLPSRLPLSGRAGQETSRRTGRLAVSVLATLATSIALALSGCATPAYHPNVDVPSTFAAARTAGIESEAAWWKTFHDPVLTDLVQRAAKQNRDIKIAVERLRAARSGVTVSRSFLMPSVGAVGTAGDINSGYGDAVKQRMPDTKSTSMGLDVSWEVDLSGRLRANATAAGADAMAAQDNVRGVRLMVMSDVAGNYFTLVGALRQIDTLKAISADYDETLRLVRARYRAGLATQFDVERAQTDAETARAQIPPLETVAEVARHRIAVLVGDQAFNAGRIQPWHGHAVVPDIHSGQPAELLERRPDVLALMAQLDAANARRREAAAEWFPRLFLGASFGREHMDLNGIDIGSARFTNAAGLLAMPIFNAGRTQAINDIAASEQRVALLRAEDGIVRALEDVENTLVAISADKRRASSLGAAATSADAALGRAQSMYDRGQIDLLPLLDAQRARLAVQLSANDSHTRLLLDSVQLYKALGGGWQVFEASASRAAPTAANHPSHS